MNGKAVGANVADRSAANPDPGFRAVVADIAYDEFAVGARGPIPIAPLVSGINGAGVTIDGRRMHTTEAWSRMFAPAIGGLGAVTLVHPTTWGRRRTEILRDAASSHCGELELVPRAVAVARSHLESAAQCAVVIEVHDRIDIHELRSSAVGWQITSTRVLTEADELPDLLHSVVDNRVEAILVDGRDREVVAGVCRSTRESTVVGRVMVADRSLLRRFGGADLPRPRIDDGPLRPTTGSRRRLIAAVATVLVIGAAAVAIGVVAIRDGTSTAPAAAADRFVQLGRVSLTVPGGWRQSSEPPAEGVVSRTTFAAPENDSRLIVLQNSVRDTSTLASVAVSLRNRIDQRGDGVVQEFSASTRFAGREVISYREVPVSGGPIRWYLAVERGLQVSIGCQNGSAGESVDAQCRAAVGSVRIAGP
ncbi:type VII secretion-associated protein [Williamsia sp.]|uniref:type VII secretion-associated protein n=1 Tax=Williamsia sp. TaxID=1872085 RepID=UPI002F92DAF2